MKSLVSAMQRDYDASFSPITVFRLAVTPDDAVSRCVGLWKMKGIRSERVGMREQFKQRGWSGTELVIGHSGRALLTDFLFNISGFENSYIEASMRSLEESFNAQGILSAPVQHLDRRDIELDSPLSLPTLVSMRKAAKKRQR